MLSWCTPEWSPGVHWNGLLVYTGMINAAEERKRPSASFSLIRGETAPKTAQFSIILNIRSSFAPYWVAQGVTFPLQRSSMLTIDLPSQHINDFFRNLDGRYTCNSPLYQCVCIKKHLGARENGIPSPFASNGAENGAVSQTQPTGVFLFPLCST